MIPSISFPEIISHLQEDKPLVYIKMSNVSTMKAKIYHFSEFHQTSLIFKE